MTVCRPCSGEAVKVKEGRVMPRGCGECVAQSLIKHGNNPFGIMPIEHAKKLCSCLASGHKKGFVEVVVSSEKFLKNQKDYSEEKKKTEAAKQDLVFQVDKEKKKLHDYYEERAKELKQLDSFFGGPEWALAERVESGESNESEEEIIL